MEKKEFVSGQLAKLQVGFQDLVGGLLGEAVDFGVSSVVIPEPPPVVGSDASEQEKIDAAVAPLNERIAALEAKLALPDATPYDQEYVDKAVSEATESLQAKIDAGDDAEEAIAEEMAALAKRVSDLHAAKSAPVEA